MTPRLGLVNWHDAYVSDGTWNARPEKYEPANVCSAGWVIDWGDAVQVILTVPRNLDPDEEIGQYIFIPKGCVVEVRYF